MKIDEFLLALKQNGWVINEKNIIPSDNIIHQEALKRLENAPVIFKDFICSFTSCGNEQDTIWFLSYIDYKDDENTEFAWNEFETQSLEAASEYDELIKSVVSFWKVHIPFLTSVKDDYLYVSICINDENFGKIYYGSEPEYEENVLIADSLEDFLSNYIKAIKGIYVMQVYKFLV